MEQIGKWHQPTIQGNVYKKKSPNTTAELIKGAFESVRRVCQILIARASKLSCINAKDSTTVKRRKLKWRVKEEKNSKDGVG